MLKSISTDTQFCIEVLFDCTSACSPQVFLENLGTHKIINHKTRILTEYGMQRFYKAVRVQWYSGEILQTTENSWHSFCQDPEGTNRSDCPLPASSGPGSHVIPPEPLSPAPMIPQQGLSPAHHSPTLPTHGISWAGLSAHSGLIPSPSPGRCSVLRMGAALGVPRCYAYGWDRAGPGLPHGDPYGGLQRASGVV